MFIPLINVNWIVNFRLITCVCHENTHLFWWWRWPRGTDRGRAVLTGFPGYFPAPPHWNPVTTTAMHWYLAKNLKARAVSQTSSDSYSGLLLSNAEIKPVSQCYTKYITNSSVYEIRRPRRTLTTYFPIVRRNCQIRRTYLSGVNCRLPK